MVRRGASLLLLGSLAAPAHPLVLDGRIFLSGGISAALSHTVSVPIDVVKTRQQARPDKYDGPNGISGAALAIVEEEGPGSLFLGAGPTLIGYFVQGSLKYGLYDAFKPVVAAALPVASPRLAVLVCAAVVAEAIASTALCPLEAARIRIVCDPSYAGRSAPAALAKMIRGDGGIKAAFAGLTPCLLKMCPYTAGQLATYEASRAAVASAAPALATTLPVQLACATLAAVVSSLLSQALLLLL